MPKVLVHHKVEDYATWKSAFDAGASKRSEKGITHVHEGAHVNDPNHVYLVFDVASGSDILSHLEHNDTQDFQKQGGVIGETHVVMLN